MGADDFMQKIKRTIENLWGQARGVGYELGIGARSPVPLDVSPQAQAPTQAPTPTGQDSTFGPWVEQRPTSTPSQVPSPTPYPRATPEGITQGLTDWGGGTAPPVASFAAQLAELGNMLPGTIDPNLIAALSLKETGGGSNLIPGLEGKNNPYGIKSFDEAGNSSFANYPDYGVATLGGGPQDQQGLKGTLMGGLYDKFLESGNLEDFFNTYTPQGEGNPTLEEQLKTMEQLLEYFK